MRDSSCRRWALEEFGGAVLGDARRTSRLVRMATEMAQNPGGRVSSVFRHPAERQGAYDFIESARVDAGAILSASVRATNRRAGQFPFVYVPLDGTSLNLTDHRRTKDFGSVGSRERGARGLKVVDAIAVAPDGTPLGIAAMNWWARGERSPLAKWRRPQSGKEHQHWLDAIEAVKIGLYDTRAWFQLDREGDAQYTLERLGASGEWFTVRSQSDRRLSITGLSLPRAGRRERAGGRRRYLRGYMRRRRPLANEVLEVPARGEQPARVASVAIRTAHVVLHMSDKRTSRHRTLPVNVVWVREHGRGPLARSRSGKTISRALDWMLLTNHPIETLEDVRAVVQGYEQRWRIEDFHRAWKSGVCRVEETQLRTRKHVIRWATVLAAVAVRAERLKHLARTTPRALATTVLSDHEVEALIVLKRTLRKQNEVVANKVPDLETATRWIAELGGYTGTSSGGPPGSTTIGRGLAQLAIATQVVVALRGPPRSD